MRTNSTELKKLYSEIHLCHVCRGMDKVKELKNADAVDLNTDVFIVSQALAEKSLRLSGVNFFSNTGQVSTTGKNLERFLNLFGRTVFPPKKITLQTGKTIPKRQEGYLTIYNTEITQCFPGKKNGNDRIPSRQEILTCLGKKFLEREIHLLSPSLILLMGDVCRKSFYDSFFGERRRDTLTAHISQVVKRTKFDSIEIGGRLIKVFPIQHASGANPNFRKMLKSKKIVTLIRRAITQ